MCKRFKKHKRMSSSMKLLKTIKTRLLHQNSSIRMSHVKSSFIFRKMSVMKDLKQKPSFETRTKRMTKMLFAERNVTIKCELFNLFYIHKKHKCWNKLCLFKRLFMWNISWEMKKSLCSPQQWRTCK